MYICWNICQLRVLQLQKSNYVTLYDEARVLWSLMFDSSDKLAAFAKQVCRAVLPLVSGSSTSVWLNLAGNALCTLVYT